jgi:hypothetical protein
MAVYVSHDYFIPHEFFSFVSVFWEVEMEESVCSRLIE